jgi:hypothetical protein
VRLVGRDPVTGANLTEYTYDDDFRVPIGLTWDGAFLWIHYPGEGTTVRAIDPATGAEVRRWLTEDGEALGWEGTRLLLAQRLGTIVPVDPVSGASGTSFDAPFPEGWLTGVTGFASHTWVSNAFRPELAILEADGRHVGVAHMPSGWPGGGEHLTAIEDEIAVVTTSIVIMQAVPR